MADNKDLIFPTKVFPKGIQELITETHSELNFPESYIAGALLLATSLAIGNTRVLIVKQAWKIKPNMFMALLGSPGAMKTQPIIFALAPFAELDKTNLENYRRELQEYRKKSSDENSEKPIARQFICKDITIEALSKVHMSNQRGICVQSDELKGFFSSFGRYNKGGDQEQWLSIYNGDSIVVNRKTTDDIIYIPNTFVNVIGGIQPEVLTRLFRGEKTENGFLSRILFVNNSSEDEPLLWKEMDLPSDVDVKWRNYIFRILDMCKYPEYETKELRFENSAWECIRNWQNETEKKLADSEPEYQISIFRKIQTYALRFAIILHTMREAEGQIEESTMIDMKTAVYATNIADYFFETGKMVYSYIYDNREDRNKFFQLINSLNNIFTTEQAIKVGSIMGISRRTVFRYLDILPEDPFLKKVKHGVYEKR